VNEITVGEGLLTGVTEEHIHAVGIEGYSMQIMLSVRTSTSVDRGKKTATGYYLRGNTRGLSSRQIRGAVDYACRFLGATPSNELARILEL
jgi:hypothetical protein